VFPFPTDKTNIPARAAAFGGFTTLAGLVALIDHRRPDVVLVMSPPITLGLAGLLVARARRVPFVFNIQDVFPDVAIELGVLTNERVIAILRRLEQFLYEQADAVTVLSEDLASNVEAKIRPGRSGSVEVIPNFVDTEKVPVGPTDNSYRREYGLVGKTVVMYAGNIGFSQSLELLIDAAAAFADRPDVAFVINGGGSAREGLIREAHERGLTNVIFVGLQPAERLAEVLAAADLHVVPLRAGLAKSSVPSKLYSILAAGRAVLASVDEGTEVARVVERAGAGRSVEPDDSTAFISALEDLLASPVELALAGANGRRFVETWASPDAVARSYEALFQQLERERRGPRSSSVPRSRDQDVESSRKTEVGTGRASEQT